MMTWAMLVHSFHEGVGVKEFLLFSKELALVEFEHHAVVAQHLEGDLEVSKEGVNKERNQHNVIHYFDF